MKDSALVQVLKSDSVLTVSTSGQLGSPLSAKNRTRSGAAFSDEGNGLSSYTACPPATAPFLSCERTWLSAGKGGNTRSCFWRGFAIHDWNPPEYKVPPRMMSRT